MPSQQTLIPIAQFPDIIIALNLLGADNTYHWMLFIADPSSDIGEDTKIHAIEKSAATKPEEQWEFESKTFAINTSGSICAAATIGRVPAGKSASDVIDILKDIPMNEVPPADIGKETRFTCRVWVREAVRRLNAARYLTCPDVDALEKEMREYGAAARDAIENGSFKEANLVRAKTSA